MHCPDYEDTSIFVTGLCARSGRFLLLPASNYGTPMAVFTILNGNEILVANFMGELVDSYSFEQGKPWAAGVIFSRYKN